MPELYELTLGEFANELGSGSPAPGGGSTAALAGAMSSSLVAMVAKITLRKTNEESKKGALAQIINESEKATRKFLQLIDDDTSAFNEIMESMKLPKDTETEKQARTAAIQAATMHAAEVPLETAQLGIKVLSWTIVLTDIGSKNAISDTGVAALMAHSAVNGAVWNVKINLGAISDSDFVEKSKSKLEKIISTMNKLWPEILENVEKNI